MSSKPNACAFVAAFKKTQEALGLSHFRVAFEQDPQLASYANIERNSSECTAYVRYNQALMERDKVLVSTAVHEVLHLLLQDLRWAQQAAPEHVADLEDERIVSRLEPWIVKAVFPVNKNK